jgi:F-type H+-transporting ATPase subunit gamma
MRPYADTMRELIAGVGRAAGSVRGLPLLEQRETTATTQIVPLAGDRGLAGAFNAQVLRRAFALERQLQAEGQAVRWLAVGKKGRSTLTFRRRTLDGAFVGFADAPTYADAQAIAHRASELFVEGEVDRVVLVPQHVRLNLDPVHHRPEISDPGRILARPRRRSGATRRAARRLQPQPEPEEILERLLPVYLETWVYRAARVDRRFRGAQ